MLKDILQKRSKIDVHFSPKNTKKGRIHQQDKQPHTNDSTQLVTKLFANPTLQLL